MDTLFIVLLSCLFVAITWAVVMTIAYCLEADDEKIISDVREDVSSYSFEGIQVYGRGTWEFVDADSTLMNVYRLYAANEHMNYPSPSIIIGASSMQPLLKLMFPNATFEPSGKRGSIRASEAFKGPALPNSYASFIEAVRACVETSESENVVYLEALENYDLISAISTVLSAHTIVSNGPSYYCLFASNLIDSLGSPHRFNQEICEMTGATYVGIDAGGNVTRKGNRLPCPVYTHSPMVSGVDAFLK